MPDRHAHRARPYGPLQEGPGGRTEEPGRDLGAVRAPATSRGDCRYLEDGRGRGGRAHSRAARRAALARSGGGGDEVASPGRHAHQGSGAASRSVQARGQEGRAQAGPGQGREEDGAKAARRSADGPCRLAQCARLQAALIPPSRRAHVTSAAVEADLTLAQAKERVARDQLGSLGSVLVAYSGGVDSSYLLWLSRDVLGDRAVAFTALSAAVPADELTGARALARSL